MGMTDKKDFLFKFVPTDIRKELKLDTEALFSTTDQLTADKITRDILRFIPKTARITDATACIGGSAFSFLQNFAYVLAIEYDKTRFQYLEHNIHQLLKTIPATIQNSIECRQGDALTECIKQYQDAIFIDPPWGGPEYKTQPSVELYLSHVPLTDVCKQFHKYTKYIILKVPTNFDEKTFIETTQEFMKHVYKNAQLRKMNILIFETLS
jgi:predicted RNA methylase